VPPVGTTIFSPPTWAPRVPAFTMPSSRSRKCTCKGGPSALGGSVPSRNRTIRPSASCLRYIRRISPLWRFSNLRKLSTIHPTCGLCAPKTSSYESYHSARQLAANCSQKRSGVIILVTHHSEGGEPESASGSCTISSRLSATRKLCRLAELSANRRSDPETALWEMSNDRSSTDYRSRSPQQID